jgi:hypothetical protein
LPGGGGLTAPYTRSNRPLWTAGFRVVSAAVGACVLKLLVEFVPRTSRTPVATWFWQTEGISAERVIWGSDRASSSYRSFNLPREGFLSAPIHSPLSGRLIGPSSQPVILTRSAHLYLPASNPPPTHQVAQHPGPVYPAALPLSSPYVTPGPCVSQGKLFPFPLPPTDVASNSDSGRAALRARHGTTPCRAGGRGCTPHRPAPHPGRPRRQTLKFAPYKACTTPLLPLPAAAREETPIHCCYA